MAKQSKTTKLSNAVGYAQLVKKIESELSELDFFIRRRTAEAYWRVGKFIHVHILEHKEKADYGQELFEQLEKDVKRDKTTLRRAVQFYLVYPIGADQRQLSWDHYKRLITVQDEAKRASFEKTALQRDWTAEELGEAIRLDRLTIERPTEKPREETKKLATMRARLYAYQVLEPRYIHPVEERFIIDLGFSVLIHAEIKGLRLKAGELIESQKSGAAYSFKHSDAKPRELYTYKALVERVIDADTIWLNIDLGFDCWTRQKVRLRAIDAPELATKEGQESKTFVEARLKETPFVLIKTYKSDKYDRYLSDVFYLKDENDEQIVLSQGTFLNQELLNLGLAQLMSSE